MDSAVIHLLTTTHHGVSGKDPERQLGVTHKTAWRVPTLILLIAVAVVGGGFSFSNKLS